MKGTIKSFDEKLYNKYDIPARNLIKEKLGDIVEDNPDIYAQDLLLKYDGCKYKYIELQVCATWFGEGYPYDKPFVFERKAKFSVDTLYFIFDKHMKKCLIFNRNSLYQQPRRYAKYSRWFVYDVPWHCILPVTIEELSRETLLLYTVK